jgi:hypothetical protein
MSDGSRNHDLRALVLVKLSCAGGFGKHGYWLPSTAKVGAGRGIFLGSGGSENSTSPPSSSSSYTQKYF